MKASLGTSYNYQNQLLAVAERTDFKDQVSIYYIPYEEDPSCWCLVKSFPVETLDLAGITWSPDGSCIVVWDGLTQVCAPIKAGKGSV